MPEFSHLHVHTQFSLLDGAANISTLIKKAKNNNMKAVAITDHGNMFGVFSFVATANKEGVKPIIGCEFYVVADRHKKQFSREERDVRHHQLLLAKDAEGYKNLSKLCSLGFTEGLYSKYPRIDKELIEKYHKGLIATSCCIGAEIPQLILNKGEEAAEEQLKWWLNMFGEDYYIELQRHELEEQDIINKTLLKFAKKYNVKTIATNDSHYVDEQDFNAHDILLCVNTGELQSTPVGDGKGFRFGFPNNQFYFKSQEEMNKLFHDVPESIDNTNEIVDKIQDIKLKRDILLPNFPIPPEFKIHQGEGADNLNQWEYLRHLTMEGAKRRYNEITPEIEERLNFELFTVKTMGFAGYFLIVMDFIKAGRDIGVLVGPGRGSAAGSAVAYCIGITNIDPIKYNLLFERFLNPERKSMPDIDTDFDDEGRQRVIDYVVDKYGKNQVAHIVTYGSMAAKMSIKDVARVLDLPLDQSNLLAKCVPDKPGISLNRVLKASIDGDGSLTDENKEGLRADQLEGVKELRKILDDPKDVRSKVLKEASVLEGSVRGTGIHAAGIIIAPSDLTELMPMTVAKDADLLVTQYEGKVIEDAGVIKMDFLGLKTLTIIKNTLKLIKKNYGKEIEIDDVDLTDQLTFEKIFSKGETNGIFQFESAGMQKYMKELRPDKFEDIIAMNALYRPGPLAYIPNYIKRKHGQEEIIYDLDDMKEYLEDTYGITVYQEQVMLLSQKLAGFSKGEADILRKAMGKKDRATLDKMKSKFVEGAVAKGHAADKLEKIWTDWEAFAQYAFNKSHSTCYAFVAFQTAWLKAHYTAEFLAANLTNEKDNIEKVTYFLEECKRQGVVVLGPDVNESSFHFDVNSKGEIRFGLGAIKGTGEAAVEAIIQEREKNGPYKDLFDFAKRVNLRTVNKKTFEVLALGGAFDRFPDIHRAQFFHTSDKDPTNFIEKLIRYGNAVQNEQQSNQSSLFGSTAAGDIANPKLPVCEPWGEIEKLRREKEVVGFYISGHPLDQFRVELENFCTCTIDKVMDHKNKDITIGGIVSKVAIRQSKNGKSFAIFSIEDYNESLEMAMFGEDYLKNAYLLKPGEFLHLRGKVQVRYNTTDQWEFRPNAIQLLTDIRAKMCKGIQVNIEIRSLKPETLESLEKLVAENKGSGLLRVMLTDNLENINIDMFSRKYKIEPNNSLIEGLNRLEGVGYKFVS
jgi:DNA polymerase-3 subunit alpha